MGLNYQKAKTKRKTDRMLYQQEEALRKRRLNTPASLMQKRKLIKLGYNPPQGLKKTDATLLIKKLTQAGNYANTQRIIEELKTRRSPERTPNEPSEFVRKIKQAQDALRKANDSNIGVQVDGRSHENLCGEGNTGHQEDSTQVSTPVRSGV